jgi:hypothetical protein
VPTSSWKSPISKHFFQERRIETVQPDFVDLGAPPGARMTPSELIDRQTDGFTQAAVSAGRKAATVASGLAADTVNKAMAAQAKGWEDLLAKVLGGGPAEGREKRSTANVRQ